MRKEILRRGWLAALTLATGMTQAGVNSWTLNSPDGGSVSAVAIHPTDPDLMLAQTRGGFYRTTDAGAHWAYAFGDYVLGSPVANGSIVFDPTDPAANRVFMAAVGVFRSDDRGASFRSVSNPSTGGIMEIAIASDGTIYVGDQFARVFRSGDQGQSWTEVPETWPVNASFGITALVVDPNDPNRLYVGTAQHGIFRSDDRGATWVAPAPNSPGLGANAGVVTSIAVQPGNSDRLLATAGEYSYFTSSNRGASWTRFFSFFNYLNWAGFDPGAPANAVVLSTQGLVLRSTDSGDSWPVALSSSIGDFQYVSRAVFAPGRSGRLVVATTDGPYLSDDGGQSFSQRITGLHAGTVSDFAAADDGRVYAGFDYGSFGIFRREASGWMPVNNTAFRNAAGAPQLGELAASPTDSNLVYAVSSRDVLRTRDGGVSWSSVAGAYSVNGIPQDVAIDPSDPRTVYIGTYAEGLWRTVDDGISWQRLAGGLPQRIDVVAVDPANTQTLYVLTTDEPNAVYKSTNGGASWSPTGNLQRGTRQGITFDPENTQTLYVFSGGDVQKSTDGGASFSPLDFGPPGNNYARAMAVMVDPGAHDTVWVVSHPYTPGFTRSVDGGLTWERTTLTLPQARDNGFLDAAVLDPLRPNVLYVGVTGIGIVEYEVAPDLAISLEGLAVPLAADSTVNGGVTVRNLGPHAASSAEVRINLPSWIDVTVPQYCRRLPGLLVCELPPIRVGTPHSIPLALAVAQAPGSGQVSATVAGHERDPVASNDSATLDLSSTIQSNIALTLETATPIAGRGDSVTFTARLNNPGPSRARDARLELQLGTLTAEEVIGPSNACTRNGAVVTCTFGTLEAANAVTVTVRALASTIGANTVTGTATRAGSDADASDAASLGIQARPVADFSVETVDSPDPVVSGGVITYTSTIRNNGPDAGTSTYTMLTTGVTVNSFTISGGICGANGTATVICTVNSLASGATATVTISATAGAAGNSTYTSTATLDGIDRVAGNNQAASNTVITAPPAPPRKSGGGGGRVDWLLAVLLGLLLALRQAAIAAAAHQQRRQHSRA